MCLLSVASKVTPTPEEKYQSFKMLYSVEGMLLCREADTRLAHRGTFGEANFCFIFFLPGSELNTEMVFLVQPQMFINSYL